MVSKYIPIFNATISDGKLFVKEKQLLSTWLWTLNDKEVRVVIEQQKRQRSSNQNRYFFGVVIQMIADETGATSEDVHSEMKKIFLRIGGNKIPITKSTTDLSPMEFEDYISKIRIWANTELNLNIPLPNEIII